MADPRISSTREKNLRDKMRRLGIREKDLFERFIRSKGPGGQKVNKSSSCVYIRHKPTGTEVKCGRERSQALNRFLARQTIVCKIERVKSERSLKEKQQAEKIRRRDRKRSKGAKEKMLEDKKKRSVKKALRRRVKREEDNS